MKGLLQSGLSGFAFFLSPSSMSVDSPLEFMNEMSTLTLNPIGSKVLVNASWSGDGARAEQHLLEDLCTPP
jgi:hypothetical protein